MISSCTRSSTYRFKFGVCKMSVPFQMRYLNVNTPQRLVEWDCLTSYGFRDSLESPYPSHRPPVSSEDTHRGMSSLPYRCSPGVTGWYRYVLQIVLKAGEDEIPVAREGGLAKCCQRKLGNTKGGNLYLVSYCKRVVGCHEFGLA